MSGMRIGTRLRALREERGLTQEEVTAMLGLKHRQSLAAIESGERRVTADELLRAVEAFKVGMDQFTNPFLVTGEARFSWRRADLTMEELNTFEVKAGEWIGAYRALSVHSGIRLSAFQNRVGLTSSSTFEEASEAGERVSQELALGVKPSHGLADAIEDKLSTLVLMVDAHVGISGAACLIQDLSAVLINRNEAGSRRAFDLAHELFHILTWDAMPPERLDGTGQARSQKRIEQLADNFASALLMPRDVLARYPDPTGDMIGWLNATATDLGVSAQALKWRMVTIGRLDRGVATAMDDDGLRNNGRPRSEDTPPDLFSRKFVTVIATAIAGGHLSVRKAAKLLSMTIEDLAELCDAYRIERPFDL